MTKILPFPKSVTPATPAKRLDRRTKAYRNAPLAQIVSLDSRRSKAEAYALYLRASKIDDDSPRQGLELYTRAIAIDPTLDIALTNRGNCHYRLHDLGSALSDYNRALSINPHQCEALYNTGFMQLEGGDALSAVKSFRAALTSDSKFADAWFNLGTALAQTNQRGASAWAFQRYLELEPTGEYSDFVRSRIAQ